MLLTFIIVVCVFLFTFILVVFLVDFCLLVYHFLCWCLLLYQAVRWFVNRFVYCIALFLQLLLIILMLSDAKGKYQHLDSSFCSAYVFPNMFSFIQITFRSVLSLSCFISHCNKLGYGRCRIHYACFAFENLRDSIFASNKPFRIVLTLYTHEYNHNK